MKDTAQQGHTMGPWEAICSNHIVHLIKGVDNGIRVELCRIDTTLGTNTDEANARLIAAAPELYEVIKNALVSIQIMKLPQGVGVASNNQILEIMQKSFEQAIAKAQGK
mgnify:CR=1 FL=1